MRLKFFAFFVIVLAIFVLPTRASADENFDISTNATYEVADSGLTRVTQKIRIRNKTEFTYTPSYTITTGITDVKNLQTFNNLGAIPHKLTESEDGKKSIEINFPDRIVGFGRVNEFTVSFDTNLIARKKGSIWEVSVPGLSDPSSFDEYNITLNVPTSFGEPSVTKPKRLLQSKGPYVFSKNEIGSSGILILFGQSQYYKLALSYHIENPRIVPVKTEVALPPETSYQDVRIEKITPEPIDVYQDEDGNWLAVYALSSREKKTISVEAYARVFASPVFEINDPKYNLSHSKYWEVENPAIKMLASELKTPEKIYNYVVGKLSYDYDKVDSKNVRVGAAEVLKEPEFAVCLEYTDLFVALARASGIRARSVEGYAYTQDSKLRPLSLVQDVLHSWPEFYDEARKTWIMVDPTWADTTHGMDYFNSFDFDHVAFVVKGRDSTYPVPAGGYKLSENSKDVRVDFSNEVSFRDIIKSDIQVNFPQYTFSLLPVRGQVVINNLGNKAIKNRTVYIKSDLSPSYQEFYIDSIPPYGKKSLTIVFDKTPFLTNKPHNITILFDGNSSSRIVRVGFFPDYLLIIVGGAVVLGSTIVSVFTYKTWSIYIQKRGKPRDLRRKGSQS